MNKCGLNLKNLESMIVIRGNEVMRRILIIEDEDYMLNLMRIHLSSEYEITEIKDGGTALEVIQKQAFDLIILDIMLPYVNGWTICEKVREKNDTPIIMLTARSELQDRVKGLEIGADDYLIKPFEFDELKARIKALLRRYDTLQSRSSQSSHVLVSFNGKMAIDNESRQIKVNLREVDFTAKEFDLIWLLASQPHRVFTREILLDQIWDIHESRDLRIVDTHVKNIRTKFKKMDIHMNVIKTVWGIGYKFHNQESQ